MPESINGTSEKNFWLRQGRLGKGLIIGGGAVALLIIGAAAGHSSGGAQTTAAHTVIKWKTRTIVEPGPTITVIKTIHVPAPAKTVYVTAPAQPGNGGGAATGTNQIIARFNGSGTQNTPTFTTPDNWHLSWAYWGCPFGTSNFQVYEYNADGSLDPNGISVNELGTGRGPVATYAYGDAGTHYLSINTEGCSWSLVPVTT